MRVELTAEELTDIATALVGEHNKQVGQGNRQRAERIAELEDKINKALAIGSMKEYGDSQSN